jgi:hypothetical protein
VVDEYDPFNQIRSDLAAVRAELTAQNLLTATMNAKLVALEHDVSRVEATHRDYVTASELDVKFSAISEDLVEIRALARAGVTKDEFHPVRNVVYGMVGFIMLAFLGAIVTLVLGGAGV